MHIPANPFEPARYVVYALLAVAYVSMIWNRCNARNTYTKTWRISFAGANILMPVLLLQSLQFNLASQNVNNLGQIMLKYAFPLFMITVIAVFWGIICNSIFSMQSGIALYKRKKAFWILCLIVLVLYVIFQWILLREDMMIHLMIMRPVSLACQMYEVMFLCLFFTERGYQNYSAKNVLFEGK